MNKSVESVQPCVLITGASSGIGFAAARAFAQAGADVALTARGERGLEAAAEEVRAEGTADDLVPAELAKGFGFFHGKPWTAFSPVAVTPDELGDSWSGGGGDT